jgi:hypothetical protein
MTSTVDERVFFVAMSRLGSNHTSTRAHLQSINVVQDALCQCAMGYDTIDHGLWKCGLHCALRNELQEKLRATGMDHGSSVRDILAMRNMVALRLIFKYSNSPKKKCISQLYMKKKPEFVSNTNWYRKKFDVTFYKCE